MKDILDLAARHWRRNRTIVSSDIRPILEDVARIADAPLLLHSFPSGSEWGTWIIPPRWDVREAWLKGPDGNTIASHKQHPLFVAPYSMPFEGTIQLEELKPHIRSHPTQHDAFFYEHRLAYDFKRRLKEWIITLPLNTVKSLPSGKYQVKIDIDVGDGEMLVGELRLRGRSDKSIALLADYCHPGQVNDSFSGLLAMVDVMRRLKTISNRRYSYSLFLLPETIGSCALLSRYPKLRKTIRAAIFSEFVGWGEKWVVSVNDKPGSLASLLAAESALRWPEIKVVDLFEGWGNDEYVFDYAGIPSMAVQKFDCPEYHSSNDEPSRLKLEDLKRASDIIFRMCRLAENDALYSPVHPVPIYMTRFDLYLDAVERRQDFRRRRSILYALKGKKSLLEISVETGIPFEEVKEFADQLLRHNLIKKRASRR